MAIFIALFQPRDFCLRFLACEVSRAPKDYHRTTLRDEGGSKMAAQVDLAMLPKGLEFALAMAGGERNGSKELKLTTVVPKAWPKCCSSRLVLFFH